MQQKGDSAAPMAEQNKDVIHTDPVLETGAVAQYQCDNCKRCTPLSQESRCTNEKCGLHYCPQCIKEHSKSPTKRGSKGSSAWVCWKCKESFTPSP